MRRLLIVLIVVPLFGLVSLNLPSTASAADGGETAVCQPGYVNNPDNPASCIRAGADSCGGNFLLPTWYKYLNTDAECEIIGPLNNPNDLDSGIDWAAASGRVALAIVEIMIRVATLVAVGFVMYGGFRYITSQGEPENTKSARQTIQNAIIGLIVSLIATALVAFITNTFIS